MRKSLKNKICLSLVGTVLYGGGILYAPAVYAAPSAAQIAKAEKAVENLDNPNYYANRVRQILAEYHRVYDETHNSSSRRSYSADGNEKAPVPVPKNIAPALKQNYSSEPKYDFDWQGTPIAQSLYAVGKAAGKNIIVNGKLEGDVYISLHGVTCGQTLDWLSKSFEFNWMEDNGAIVIGTDEVMLQSKEIRLHHINGEKAKEELKALGIDEEKIYANSETGTISVTGTSYELQQATRRIKSIDHPVSQCLVLAQIIEINHGDKLNLGFSYSLPTYSHTGTTDANTTDAAFRGNWLEKLTFSGSFQASKEMSKGHVIARPMTMMLNGEEGVVNFSDRVPIMTTTSTSTSTDITVSYEDVGTVLKVTPNIDEASNSVRMKIETEIANISQWRKMGATEAPQIASRKAITSAHFKSGQSFVIGGLMTSTELDNLAGIPGLMNLPILGKLFQFHTKSKSYAEVYVMITPYIVTDDISPADIMRKVGN